MGTLLVGFDSAWTATNAGAIAGVLRSDGGNYEELGPPVTSNYPNAQAIIERWQSEHSPTATVVMLDQPTIVENATGQRPVENLVASPVSRRYGGVQPANTGRSEMFGIDAPIWAFLTRFGGPADPLRPMTGTAVVETYPVLTMIALGWTLPDVRPSGRLPKYNPARRKTFSISDWQHVCRMVGAGFSNQGITVLSNWLDTVSRAPRPGKKDQDCVDACICLLTAIRLSEGGECLMVGDHQSGYIVVPYFGQLYEELRERSLKTGRVPADWVHKCQLTI